MRKLVLFLHSSLDGIVEGPKGAMDIGFVSYDQDLEAVAREVLLSVDTIVWGRETYQGMHNYWPQVAKDPDATAHELKHAQWIEQVEKVVLSRTLDKVEWTNSRLIKEDAVNELRKLKELPNRGDMLILGSPRLAHVLMQENLIDEYKITVSPVLVGRGLRLFENIKGSQKLKLLHSQTLPSGVLSLTYGE